MPPPMLGQHEVLAEPRCSIAEIGAPVAARVS